MPRGSRGFRRITESVEANDTAFGTRVADNTTNRIDAPGTYNFNTGRHRFIEDRTTNGGTFIRQASDSTALSDRAGKFQVTASAGEEHLYGAREAIRYVPNYELLVGISAWAESSLTEGQHYACEFMNDAATEGYRFRYDGGSTTALTLEQVRQGTVVKSVAVDLDDVSAHDETTPAVYRILLNWYGAGIAEYNLSYPQEDATGEVVKQANPTLGKTANADDVATSEINNRIQMRVWADAGAADVTVNVSSCGALIRGNATEINREKPGVFWNIGNGAISQYPTDNVPAALAARVDPDRRNVAIKALPPLFQPATSGVTMSLGVYAVHKDHPDLEVNFADPDDDGTDEGAEPSAQSRAETDVLQFTRDVTSIPTRTGAIRADGTTGPVPDMRNATITVGEAGSQKAAGASTGGESAVERLVFPEDVVVFLPRTDPAGNTNDGTLQFLKPLFLEDF